MFFEYKHDQQRETLGMEIIKRKTQLGLFLNPSAQKWTGINDEKHLGTAGAERAGCGADMNKQ